MLASGPAATRSASAGTTLVSSHAQYFRYSLVADMPVTLLKRPS